MRSILPGGHARIATMVCATSPIIHLPSGTPLPHHRCTAIPTSAKAPTNGASQNVGTQRMALSVFVGGLKRSGH
ncbi:MAG TPA: hypothetical protein K8V47_04705 [Candidatus Amulumruptor caecigallinarius]|uniref:Uncharacterized protein n=1 Tax=Candidatus Amulumruptor caecigallinarius TaxID=2109911 RepID=A0A921E8B5_9BACT|nr:hypothetical protein [Candidatus Amulumruptor caecigallinarius]